MAIKKAKLSGAEIKANRIEAERRMGYGESEKALIKGKTTAEVAGLAIDYLLVGDLDAAKLRLKALLMRERVHYLTFHPYGEE